MQTRDPATSPTTAGPVTATAWSTAHLWRVSPARVLTGLIAIGASLYVLGFLIASALRLAYPYPLDRTEEASLGALRRLLDGLPLYGPPSLTSIPVVYPPLYFYVSAIPAGVLGPSLLPMRLVSLLASLAGAIVIAALVGRETRSRTLGLLSAAVFLGSTPSALTTLDLARVDALGTTLILGAVLAMRLADDRPDSSVVLSLISGLLAGLSILTKQPYALVAGALGVYAVVNPRARLLPYVLALIVSLVLPLLLLAVQSGPWLRTWLVDLPSLHMIEEPHLDQFWPDHILPHFTLPLVLGPLYVVSRLRHGERRAALFSGGLMVSLLAVAWAGWALRGSAQNVLEPAYAGLAILFGLAIAEIRSLIDDLTAGARLLRDYALALCLVQLILLGYNPRATVPPRSEAWAGDRLVARISQLRGTVLAPDLAEWTRAAGKGDQPPMGAVLEVLGAFSSTDNPVGNAWRAELHAALARRDYDFVLWDPQSDAFFVKSEIDGAGYVNAGPLFPADDEFNLWKTRRTPDVEVYVPAERAATAFRQP
jgi:hypothetical protein